MKLAIQIFCALLLIAVLLGFKAGFIAIANLFDGPGFPIGFLVGLFFAVIMYGLICWIDPSSRPRGSASKQDGRR